MAILNPLISYYGKSFTVFLLLFPVQNVIALEKIDDLQNSLKILQTTKDIKLIKIFHVSDDIRFITAMTPGRLQKWSSYNITDKSLINQHYTSFLQALSSTKILKSKLDNEVGWGILFIDSQNNILFALYEDCLGSDGYINKIPVTFVGEKSPDRILYWFQSNFSEIMKKKNLDHP